MKFFSSSLIFFAVLLAGMQAFAAYGLSIDGDLKYKPGFSHFDYVSLHAVKGGELVMHALGTFDKMNPFTLKGTAPDDLERYVFEPLGQASLDEPFSIYGLLAKDIIVAPDQLSITFVLDENARFSDGSPVTAEDVKFTLDTLKSNQAHPLYAYYYADIDRAEILDRYTVKMYFHKVNRELPLIACQIAVLSKNFYKKHPFQSNDLVIPIGSGPYVVDSFKQGVFISYKKNPHYWAVDKPVRRGLYNFERITIKYYKDQTVAVEAFKAGEFDVMLVNIAKQWARDMTGGQFDDGSIVKRKFHHHNNAGMQGFVMNTRRPVFRDPVVRKAINMAFDFDWTNKTLFYGQYTRSTSFFSNSYLAARGLPSAEELKLLEPFRDRLPSEVFSKPLGEDIQSSGSGMRHKLQLAAKLLKANGWSLKDGVLQNSSGVKLTFEIILASPSFERVMASFSANLKKIGIIAHYRTIDPTLYTERINNFDFDMCVYVFAQSLSPGNEQREFWTSAAADTKGSRNLAGIHNPVVDDLVDKIIYAKNKEQLTTACRALDRVLWYGYYVVPNWYLDGHRIAYRNIFNFPEKLPKYYNYNQLIDTWWGGRKGK